MPFYAFKIFFLSYAWQQTYLLSSHKPQTDTASTEIILRKSLFGQECKTEHTKCFTMYELKEIPARRQWTSTYLGVD